VVSALDSIVNSINETVRKYCVSDSRSSPVRRTPAATTCAVSTSASNGDVPSLSVSKLRHDISASPCSSAAPDHSWSPPKSVSRMAGMNNDAGELSFADLARQTSALTSPDCRPTAAKKPVLVDVGTQVNPVDFSRDDLTSNDGRTEIGVQAGGDELLVSVDGGSFSGHSCPYCHCQLPAGAVTSTKDAEILPSNTEMDPSNPAVASSISVEDNRTRTLSSPLKSSAVLSTVTSPVSLPSLVQCSLSLGDSYHCSPVRNISSMAAAPPITICPSSSVSSFNQNEPGSCPPALAVSAFSLPINTSLTDNGLGSADYCGGLNGSAMHSDQFVSLPNAHSESGSESSLVNAPVVTFSITPEAARLPVSADSGGQLSNTSLSNITLSDLLPSMQGSIPLELLVNQSDGFTMYTEIVPVSEPCHVDPLSENLPASSSNCAGARISEVAVSHELRSPTQLVSQQSPVNMMVCLPISSVSSPSLSSFLSQHKSLSSFAGDAVVSRPPSPGTLAPGDTIEAVAVAMVPAVEDEAPKPVENYSIHRIVETSALKQAAEGVADCSWSSSNTGVLISRRDIAANSAALSDTSVAEGDYHGQPPDDNCHGNDDNGCHVDNGYNGNHSFHGNNSCYGDESCRGDDSDTHDDICVIDSDRDVIVIDGDDEILRPNVGSDAAATVPERTSRVGRHGRRRRRQTTKSSDADRLCRRAATSSVTVELDVSDHSTSVNCLDNGFVELSPSAAVTSDVDHKPHPDTSLQVILF